MTAGLIGAGRRLVRTGDFGTVSRGLTGFGSPYSPELSITWYHKGKVGREVSKVVQLLIVLKPRVLKKSRADTYALVYRVSLVSALLSNVLKNPLLKRDRTI